MLLFAIGERVVRVSFCVFKRLSVYEKEKDLESKEMCVSVCVLLSIRKRKKSVSVKLL